MVHHGVLAFSLTYQRWILQCHKRVQCIYSEQTAEFYCLLFSIFKKYFLLLAVLFAFSKNDWIYSSLKEEEYCIKWKNIAQVKG